MSDSAVSAVFAALTLYGGTLVPYYLDEERSWSMDVEHVKKQLNEARANGKTCAHRRH